MDEQKRRHGCLTAWLVLLIVVNSLWALIYLFSGQLVRQLRPSDPDWFIPVAIITAVLNLGFAVALFSWRRWGFWGYLATSIAALVVNASMGRGIGQLASGLLFVAVLYGTLQIGDEDKGWPQLE